MKGRWFEGHERFLISTSPAIVAVHNAMTAAYAAARVTPDLEFAIVFRVRAEAPDDASIMFRLLSIPG